MVDMNYNSVTNWNKSNKIPQWVKSWLNFYIENKKYNTLKQILKDTVTED